jgi:hypothetical protein
MEAYIDTPTQIAQILLECFDKSALALFRRYLNHHPQVRKWIMLRATSASFERTAVTPVCPRFPPGFPPVSPTPVSPSQLKLNLAEAANFISTSDRLPVLNDLSPVTAAPNGMRIEALRDEFL